MLQNRVRDLPLASALSLRPSGRLPAAQCDVGVSLAPDPKRARVRFESPNAITRPSTTGVVAPPRASVGPQARLSMGVGVVRPSLGVGAARLSNARLSQAGRKSVTIPQPFQLRTANRETSFRARQSQLLKQEVMKKQADETFRPRTNHSFLAEKKPASAPRVSTALPRRSSMASTQALATQKAPLSTITNNSKVQPRPSTVAARPAAATSVVMNAPRVSRLVVIGATQRTATPRKGAKPPVKTMARKPWMSRAKQSTQRWLESRKKTTKPGAMGDAAGPNQSIGSTGFPTRKRPAAALEEDQVPVMAEENSATTHDPANPPQPQAALTTATTSVAAAVPLCRVLRPSTRNFLATTRVTAASPLKPDLSGVRHSASAPAAIHVPDEVPRPPAPLAIQTTQPAPSAEIDLNPNAPIFGQQPQSGSATTTANKENVVPFTFFTAASATAVAHPLPQMPANSVDASQPTPADLEPIITTTVPFTFSAAAPTGPTSKKKRRSPRASVGCEGVNEPREVVTVTPETQTSAPVSHLHPLPMMAAGVSAAGSATGTPTPARRRVSMAVPFVQPTPKALPKAAMAFIEEFHSSSGGGNHLHHVPPFLHFAHESMAITPSPTASANSVSAFGNNETAPNWDHLNLDEAIPETPENYGVDGYLSVHYGDKFCDGRYVALARIGHGKYSTVWLMHDRHGPHHAQRSDFVAIKIGRAMPPTLRVDIRREMDILKHLQQTVSGAFQSLLTTHVDAFVHAGPHGHHGCMVFKVLGPTLLKLVYERAEAVQSGLPLDIHAALRIFRCILRGTESLHAHHIVHTDLKPENVLLAFPDEKVLEVMQDYTQRAGLPPPHIDSHEPIVLTTPVRPALLAPPPPAFGASSSSSITRQNKTPASASRPCTNTPQPRSTSVNRVIFWSPAPGQKLPVAENDHGVPDHSNHLGQSLTIPKHAFNPPESMPLNPVAERRTPQLPRPSGRVTHPDVAVLFCTPPKSFRPFQLEPAPKKENDVLLSDFGLSFVLRPNHPLGPPGARVSFSGSEPTVINHDRGMMLQTREYRAPEIILGQDFGTKIDVYSIACMMIELITGEYLWDPKFTVLHTQRVPKRNPAEQEIEIDREHLQHMVEVLGSEDLAKLRNRSSFHGSRYFQSNGELRTGPNVRKRQPGARPVSQILAPHVPVEMVEGLSELFTNMLSLIPSERWSVTKCLQFLKKPMFNQ